MTEDEIFVITAEIVVKGEVNAKTVSALLEAVLQTELHDVSVRASTITPYHDPCDHEWVFNGMSFRDIDEQMCKHCGALRFQRCDNHSVHADHLEGGDE